MDLGTILAPALDVAVLLVLGVAAHFVKRGIDQLGLLTGIKLDDQARFLIDDVLAKALNFGKQKALSKASGVSLATKSEILNNAADYALTSIPDALADFGIDRERVINMLEARLEIDLDRDGRVGTTRKD